MSSNITLTLMDHLNTRLLSYLTLSEQNSQIVDEQSSAILSVSTKVASLSDQLEDNIRNLEEGFEKLRDSMHLTELSVLSMSGDNRLWILAGLGGFLLGTFAGFLRWIITGILLHVDLC